MRLLTPEQVYKIDKLTLDSQNKSVKNLMGKAGYEIKRLLLDILSGNDNPKILIVCGKGNNGGDGWSAAWELIKKNIPISVHSIYGEKHIRKDAYYFYTRCKKKGIHISFGEEIYLSNDYDIIIDAILGVGLNRPADKILSRIIEVINKSKAKVLSIDIPSGLSSQSGLPIPSAIKADITVTFGHPKLGMFLRKGPKYCGKIIVSKIGLVKFSKISNPGVSWKIFNELKVKKIIKKPKNDINKYSAGKVLIIAGSKGMIGSSALSTYAALRTGVGITITTIPESLYLPSPNSMSEGIYLPLKDKQHLGVLSLENYDEIMNNITGCNAALIGPGLGRRSITSLLIKKLVQDIEKPLVLDADGLFPFYEKVEMLNNRKHPLLITPHFGELAGLIGLSSTRIINNYSAIMSNFMQKFNKTCLVKQIPTCVFNGNSAVLGISGNPGLATAGSGDVLSGVILALLGQGMNIVDAAQIGTYIHGKASDMLIPKLGYRGQIASDVIRNLPKVIKSYEQS